MGVILAHLLSISRIKVTSLLCVKVAYTQVNALLSGLLTLTEYDCSTTVVNYFKFILLVFGALCTIPYLLEGKYRP